MSVHDASEYASEDLITAAALEEKAKLKKHFTQFDIFFFLICAIVGVDTLGQVAADGPQGFVWLIFLAVFFFIWTWNEFLLPLVLLVSNDNQTVSVAMGVLSGQYVSDPTTTAAAALLGMSPTIIFFLIFQRTLTRGVVVGAVK